MFSFTTSWKMRRNQRTMKKRCVIKKERVCLCFCKRFKINWKTGQMLPWVFRNVLLKTLTYPPGFSHIVKFGQIIVWVLKYGRGYAPLFVKAISSVSKLYHRSSKQSFVFWSSPLSPSLMMKAMRCVQYSIAKIVISSVCVSKVVQCASTKQ